MNQIVEFNPFEAQMQEFRARYSSVVYDLTIPAQEKQARSDRFAIGKVISALDAAHSEIKAPLLEKTRLLDGERKRIKDELLEIQGKIKSQIEAHEAKIQAKVDAIRALTFDPLATPTAAEVSERLAQAEAIDLESGYEDCKEDAALAIVETKNALKATHKQAIDREELERLRKERAERERIEREERIRKEAAERATREAEERARRELDAEKKRTADAETAKLRAEQESKAAAERAAKAERERIEKEQREAAAKVEAARKAEEARKAKVTHRKKIEHDAVVAFMAHGIDEKTAERVVELIAAPAIIHVRIEY